MPKRVKLSDIAARVGVGKSTVHRALNHDTRCSKETAELIRKVAQEMGYRPDPIFSTMGSRRGRKSADSVPLAYLYNRPPGGKFIGRNHFNDLKVNADRLGYRLEQINIAEFESQPSRIWSILYARGCAGVLVNSPREELAQLLQLNDRFPVVLIGRGDPLPYNTVRPAILQSMHLAWERMHSLGYRRIGALIYRHEPMAEDDFSRLAGALASAEVLPNSAKIPPYLEPHGNNHGVADWLKKHKPDAVLAFGVAHYYHLQDLGFRIPEAFGFACLHVDATPNDDPVHQHIAGISQNQPEIARAAINLLDQMIRQGEFGSSPHPLNILVPPTWRDGATLPQK
jgi:LacI family transcriptional regulator